MCRYKWKPDILQKKCFPNRPMKLVRPHVGNRPRERHICQLCKMQVKFIPCIKGYVCDSFEIHFTSK